MEKTNACNIQFFCYGSSMCKHANPYPPEYTIVGDHLRRFCIHYYEGNCTSKEAQGEAKSERY